jgi:Tfp pilus assembly protein PilZ
LFLGGRYTIDEHTHLRPWALSIFEYAGQDARPIHSDSTYGWIQHIDTRQVLLSTEFTSDGLNGKLVEVSLTGLKGSTQFVGKVIGAAGNFIKVSVPDAIRIVAPNESCRYLREHVLVKFENGDNEAFAGVIDLGDGGLAILHNEKLPTGATVLLELESPVGPVQFTGEVVYAHPDPRQDEQHRIGLKIVDIDRLHRARWNLVLESCALNNAA